MKLTRIKLILILTLSLILTVQISTARAQTTNSVPVSQTTQAAQNGDALTICNERLVKVLTALEASESLTKAVQAENESRKTKSAIDEGIINQQAKLIEILTKQSRRKFSVFFGLVKITF